MNAAGGLLGTFPGRVTVRVRVPDDLLDEADRRAEGAGVDRAFLLGDLVASALPDALAEAARDLLENARDAATPPDVPAARRSERPSLDAGTSVPAGRPESAPVSDVSTP